MQRLIKSLVLVGVLTAVWAAPTLSVQAGGKLFLFAGQSNATGIGVWSNLTAAERAAATNVLVFVAAPNHAPPLPLSNAQYWVPPQGYLSNYTTWGYSGVSWNAMDPGMNNYPDNFGPEFTCMRDLADGLGAQTYFAKYSLGGSGLDSSFTFTNGKWDPTAVDPGSPADYTLSLYHSMVSWANKALAAARVIDPTTEIAGFFWMQGEADTTELAAANRYQANLTSLIARLRSDVGKTDLSFVIGRIANQAYLLEPFLNNVRAAEANVDAADPNAVMVNTDGLTMDLSYHIHYTDASLKIVGSRFAQAWFSLNPQPPRIARPANVMVNTDFGKCYATGVALGTPATSASCVGGVSVWNNAPAQFNKGVTLVTWTAQDACGSTATCTQSVTVNDTQPPSITSPANVTVNADAGCYATGVSLGVPLATNDNCEILTVTNNAPAQFFKGVTTVTWTAVDTSGNWATCSQIVTVLVGADCPTFAGCTAINVALGSPVVSDCSGTSMTNDAPVVYLLGTNVVTWTVTDDSGNTATFTQRVIVRDLTPPTITCPADVTVTANSGRAATNVALGTPVTGDNCSVASVVNNAPAVYPLGLTVVTWTVTDGSGNTTVGFQTVTVVPSSSPLSALAISSDGARITITWDGGVLQQADDLLGVYTDAAGAASPYTITIAGSEPQQFYRVRMTGP